MKVEMNANMRELQEVVVGRLYCLWSLFLENVEAEGWSAKDLANAANECHDRRSFVKLACQFV